jgi:ubiquinone/menaquinone biosynthesis C-methylase UbiE
MPNWSEEEFAKLEGILSKIAAELEPLPGKEVLVLCSGAGEVVLWLGRRMERNGRVVGLDLSEELLELSRGKARAAGLEGIVQFQKAELHRIPFPDGTLDALVSEFILYPAPLITQIGQPEMARVLKPGGVMVLTDVIATKPLEEETKELFRSVGLSYLCEATQDDFRGWMESASRRSRSTISPPS